MRICCLCVLGFFFALSQGSMLMAQQAPLPPKPSVKVAGTNPQQGDFSPDGNRLLTACTQAIRFVDGEELDNLQSVKAMYCLGYIRGVIGAHSWFVVAKNTSPLFCMSGGETGGQGARILVKWLKEHPEKLHIDSNIVALAALREAFPCQPEEPSP